jgi:hypothetical protein
LSRENYSLSDPQNLRQRNIHQYQATVIFAEFFGILLKQLVVQTHSKTLKRIKEKGKEK